MVAPWGAQIQYRLQKYQYSLQMEICACFLHFSSQPACILALSSPLSVYSCLCKGNIFMCCDNQPEGGWDVGNWYPTQHLGPFFTCWDLSVHVVWHCVLVSVTVNVTWWCECLWCVAHTGESVTVNAMRQCKCLWFVTQWVVSVISKYVTWLCLWCVLHNDE